MVSARSIAAAVLLLAGSTAVLAKDKTVALRDQQQEACYDDAQRLCGELMPDVDKVEECMRPKKKLVSAKCAAFYK